MNSQIGHCRIFFLGVRFCFAFAGFVTLEPPPFCFGLLPLFDVRPEDPGVGWLLLTVPCGLWQYVFLPTLCESCELPLSGDMLEITVENDVDVLGEPELLVEWSGDTPESLFLSSFDSSFYEYRIVRFIS